MMNVNNNLRPSDDTTSRDGASIAGAATNTNRPRFRSTRKSVMFEDKIRQLELFGEQHGHIEIYKADDPTLYNWIRNLRRDANEYFEERRDIFPVSKPQKKILDEMGFAWNPSRPSKTSRYYRAFIKNSKDFREKNGHGDVFREGASDPHLGKLQKSLTLLISKKDSLGKGRRNQLISFGIDLETHRPQTQSASPASNDDDSSSHSIEEALLSLHPEQQEEMPRRSTRHQRTKE